MANVDLLRTERFPRASRYHPAWIVAGASGGANALWLTEWLTEALELRPGMRVLDLGCGLASSSIFLHREFGVQVWATDLWFDVSTTRQRVRDAGAEHGVFPIRADARALPFPTEYFDAVVSVDSFPYYGTDDTYLNYLARFVRPGGAIGIAGAGMIQEFAGHVPDHLQGWWEPGHCCLHSAPWWRHHWERSGIVSVELADALPDGWRFWLAWQRTVSPDNHAEIQAVEVDGGRWLGYVRTLGRRRPELKLEEPIISVASTYARQPLLREP